MVGKCVIHGVIGIPRWHDGFYGVCPWLELVLIDFG